MTPRLLILLFIAACLVALYLVGQPLADNEPSGTTTEHVVSWGRVAPPYVIAADMFLPPPRPRARTAPTIRTTMRAASVGPAITESSLNGYPCGAVNDLPPCSVMLRESRGNPNAYNPRGCSGHGCYGLWQFDGAWRCHFGLSCDIAHWTPDEQTYAARTLWDHGRGCSNWSVC